MIASISMPDPEEGFGFRNCAHINEVNDLRAGEGWVPDPSPPRIFSAEGAEYVAGSCVDTIFQSVSVTKRAWWQAAGDNAA
jgi:hypothetical protein